MLASEQMQPHPYYPLHHPEPSSPSPARRPKTDTLQPKERTMQTCDFQHNQQTPMLEYTSYLKSVYTRVKLPLYDKWPQVKSKKYINLALIEKEDITKSEAELFMRATIHGNIDDIKKRRLQWKPIVRSKLLNCTKNRTPGKNIRIQPGFEPGPLNSRQMLLPTEPKQNPA